MNSFELEKMAPMTLIAGPCVIEDEALCHEVAQEIHSQIQGLPVQWTFKASFDKANRSSIDGFRGPGLDEGLKILSRVRDRVGCPVLTDLHETAQVESVASVVDFMQIPAFLCRQTDLIVASAEAALRHGRKLNIKKGQFLAPHDAKNIVDKVRAVEARKKLAASGVRADSGDRVDLYLTERGSTFGYNALMVDMTAFKTMNAFGATTIYDATHSIQMPGAGPNGKSTGGRREMLEPLARAAFAAGAQGLFMEVHPRPDQAKSDGPNALPLQFLRPFLRQILEIRAWAGRNPYLIEKA